MYKQNWNPPSITKSSRNAAITAKNSSLSNPTLPSDFSQPHPQIHHQSVNPPVPLTRPSSGPNSSQGNYQRNRQQLRKEKRPAKH